MRRIAAVALGLLTLSGSMAGEVAKTPVPGSPDSLARPTRGQVDYLGIPDRVQRLAGQQTFSLYRMEQTTSG
jgi:hypothetical protein